MTPAFGKIPASAAYAGVSDRTFRKWLKMGLSYSRMPSGAVLIKFSDIDRFVEKFKVNQHRVDEIVGEVMSEISRDAG